MGSPDWGSTAFATAIAQASWSTSGYNAFTLNASGEADVKFDAVSKFGARSTSDISDSAHGGPFNGSEDIIRGDYADVSGTSSDPKLVIVHSSGFTQKVMVF